MQPDLRLPVNYQERIRNWAAILLRKGITQESFQVIDDCDHARAAIYKLNVGVSSR